MKRVPSTSPSTMSSTVSSVSAMGSINVFVHTPGGQGVSPRVLELHHVILKNIGSAPALTVIAFDPEHAATIGEVQVVEPLGAGENEASRLGRVALAFQRPL